MRILYSGLAESVITPKTCKFVLTATGEMITDCQPQMLHLMNDFSTVSVCDVKDGVQIELICSLR